MKKYFLIIPILLIIYFVTYDFKEDGTSLNNNNKEVIDDINKYVKVSYNDSVINLELDNYIIGVLACEMPASFNVEALKAGAVAIRTFYMYKNKNESYVANSNDQCYINVDKMKNKWGVNFDKYYDIIDKVVKETSNEFITYNGEIIQSFYFSMSNGYTENLKNVFSEERPYLISVSSIWDKDLSSYEMKVNLKKQEFLNKLNVEDDGKVIIEILSKTESGRVEYIKVNNKIFKGTDFRKILGIRSTDFDIEVNNSDIIIITRGYGHGVGMSQYGANEMAKLGYNYEEIIKHYYTGVEITKL